MTKKQEPLETIISKEEFEDLMEDLLYRYETSINTYVKKVNVLQSEYKNLLTIVKQYEKDKKVYNITCSKVSDDDFDYKILDKKSVGFKYKGKE